MSDIELEELRRRKIAEIQRQRDQQAMAEEQSKQVEANRQAIMRQILTPEARQRLGTVKIAYPDLAVAVEDQLIRLAQSGRIDRQVDDATLRQILRKVAPQKREISIERK
ncbi:MAG: DNA-binding protein [Methanomassiliicoccales archaeon]|jgi:programmed cell death protein 5|nr:DNA-binding protein [Methanomassiliicoccales archaeon]